MAAGAGWLRPSMIRICCGSQGYNRRSARSCKQVEVKKARLGIIGQLYDGCSRRADFRLRECKSVKTQPAFACGKNDSCRESTGIQNTCNAIPAIRYEFAAVAQESDA